MAVVWMAAGFLLVVVEVVSRPQTRQSLGHKRHMPFWLVTGRAFQDTIPLFHLQLASECAIHPGNVG